MLMQKEFDLIKTNLNKGRNAQVGEDGFLPIERYTKVFEYINEMNEKGHPVCTSHDFVNKYGTGKSEFTNTLFMLRKYGVIGIHNEAFSYKGNYYRGFIYLKCNEHKVKDYMLEHFGRFNEDKFDKSKELNNTLLYSKIKNESYVDNKIIKMLKERLSYTITEEQFKNYRKLRKEEVSRSKIAKQFGIERWQLVAGADNAMKSKFKVMENVN